MLRIARIWFKDRCAGLLEETAGSGTRFTYDSDWQEEVACCFPLARREHAWEHGLHPFFEHLGPEGWLREQQARTAHLAQEDDFGLLLAYGSDCIGAVGVTPPEGLPQQPAEIAEAAVNPGRTLSGIQKKLLVTRTQNGAFEPAGATGPAPYIAKFNSQAHPDLVRNEYLSLRWTRTVLSENEVTAFQLGHVTGVNESALILTRFDRTARGGKLRLEDFAQILCKPRGRDYSGKYDASYEEIAQVIAAHSSRPAIDQSRFFKRLILFALIGNCDAHLKNFSLLETTSGLRLSPAYDIVNTAIYDGFDRELALAIGGRKLSLDALNRETFVAFGKSIGLPDRAITQTFTQLRRGVARAAELLIPPAAEPPDGFIHRYAEQVNNACLRILEP
jgi:serine/threonine-protein kinase HipA